MAYVLQIQPSNDLAIMGMNVLIVSWPGDHNVDEFFQTVRTHPTLSRFKYMLQGPPSLRALCNRAVCLQSPTTSQLHQALNLYVTKIMQNSDLSAGYYTFDEPALYQIPRSFQEATYHYIRQRDSNSTVRPIAIAHAHPRHSTGGRMRMDQVNLFMQNYMSPTAQDIVMPDEYDHSQSSQTEWINLLSVHGFLNRIVIPVLSSHRGLEGVCGYNDPIGLGQFIKNSLNALGRSAQLGGFSYFAYWPGDKIPHGFEWAIDNCVALKVSTTQHLTYEKPEVDFRWNPSTADFQNHLGQAILFGSLDLLERGFARTTGATALSGGGRFDQGLKLHPPTGAGTRLQMRSRPISIPTDRLSYLTGRVGLEQWSECGDGVRVVTEVLDIATGVRQVTQDMTVGRGSGSQRIFSDMQDYVGKNIRVFIQVHSRQNSFCDHTVFSKLHIHQVPLVDDRFQNGRGAWYNSAGQNRPFNSSASMELGHVYSSVARPVSGGGQVSNALLVHPPYQAPSSMSGHLGVQWYSPNVRSYYVGQASLSASSECGDGVQIETGVWDTLNGSGGVLRSINLPRLAGKKSLFSDFGNWNGRMIESVLRIRSLTNSSCDHTLIENFRAIHLPPLSD